VTVKPAGIVTPFEKVKSLRAFLWTATGTKDTAARHNLRTRNLTVDDTCEPHRFFDKAVEFVHVPHRLLRPPTSPDSSLDFLPERLDIFLSCREIEQDVGKRLDHAPVSLRPNQGCS
jgi:hypothetical protein